MRTRLIRNLLQLTLGFLFAATSAFPAAGAQLGTQKSSSGGVTVSVTPQNVSADAKTWDFKIVLDTHSQELNDDLMKSSLLFDAAGGQHAPVAWEGAGPGGHHREGILRFKPLPSQTRTIELQILRPAEPKPRMLRWQLQ